MEDFIRKSNEYHQKEIARLYQIKSAYELAVKETEDEILRITESNKELYLLLEDIMQRKKKHDMPEPRTFMDQADEALEMIKQRKELKCP